MGMGGGRKFMGDDGIETRIGKALMVLLCTEGEMEGKGYGLKKRGRGMPVDSFRGGVKNVTACLGNSDCFASLPRPFGNDCIYLVDATNSVRTKYFIQPFW